MASGLLERFKESVDHFPHATVSLSFLSHCFCPKALNLLPAHTAGARQDVGACHRDTFRILNFSLNHRSPFGHVRNRQIGATKHKTAYFCCQFDVKGTVSES